MKVYVVVDPESKDPCAVFTDEDVAFTYLLDNKRIPEGHYVGWYVHVLELEVHT